MLAPGVGQVSPGPGYIELEEQGKTTAYDVHNHPTGSNDTNGTVSTNEPSGVIGDKNIVGDYGYKRLKERQGAVTSPSIVIGTKNTQSVVKNEDTGKQTIKYSSERQAIFYTSKGIVGRMELNKLIQTSNAIRNAGKKK